MATHPIPVTILTGFLGAGKTTALNHLLVQPHGRKLFVIQNELGRESVDTHLLVSIEEEQIAEINGCICCSVRADLASLLMELADLRHGVLSRMKNRRLRFDHVVIETTGIADPLPIAHVFNKLADVAEEYALAGIVTLVDARLAERQLEREAAAQRQAAYADLIVINKADLVEASELDRLRGRMQAINPVAKVLTATRGQIDPGELLELGAMAQPARLMEALDRLAAKEAAPAHAHGHGHHHHHGGEDHGPEGHVGEGRDPDHGHEAARVDAAHGSGAVSGRPLAAVHGQIRSCVLKEPRRLDRQRFIEWLDALFTDQGEGLLRMKGLLRFEGEPRCMLVQGVGEHLEMELVDPPRGYVAEGSMLVLIGRGLNEAAAQRGLSGCGVG